MAGNSTAPPVRVLRAPLFWALSILVGIVAGFGAVGFRALIAFFHNLLFLGKLSATYNANVHTPPSPWGPFVILVPVIGAFGVAFLVKNFAPEAKGHGVPEVIDAIYHGGGVIRPVVSAIKALASGLSIGSGGSIGREGPIIQIGSSFGSTIAQILRLPAWQRITLVAAGAGGGIAATFNTPVGGVLFAIEIVMSEFSERTLVPVVTATATATYIGRLYFGPHPSFFIPALETTYLHLTDPALLIVYAGLGAITGLVSALFIRSIYAFERFFENRIKGGYYVQHALGMLAVGVLIYVLMSRSGHYYVEGVGYATIQDVLTGMQFPVYFAVLLFFLKLLTTSLTLGSGASGGVFSPSLFLGATAGTAYGALLNHWFPSLGVSSAAFAVAGMAGVVAGSTGAAMAAIVMIFEMTLDYTVIIPLTLTVAISYAIRKSLIRDSIYTRKLALRGESFPERVVADLPFAQTAAEIMQLRPEEAPAALALRELSRRAGDGNAPLLVVDGSGGIAGITTRDLASRMARIQPAAAVGEIAQTNYVLVRPQDSLWDVVAAMRSNHANFALVAPEAQASSGVQGVITRQDLLEALSADMEIFSR